MQKENFEKTDYNLCGGGKISVLSFFMSRKVLGYESASDPHEILIRTSKGSYKTA